MTARFLAGATHAARSGGQLMSQLLVVGAPLDVAEDSVVVDPAVLFAYPPGAPLLDASLPLFCFPDGVRLKKLRRTASSSRINEVRYSNLATLESDRSSFTFLLTGHDAVLYGVCVHSEELLDELPSLLAADSDRPRLRAGSVRVSVSGPPPPAAASASGASASASAPALCAPRCYCLVSRFPFFRLHFAFLYALLAKDRHLRMAGGAEAELLPLLRSYAQQPIPADFTALSFRLPGDLHEFAFELPGADQVGEDGLSLSFFLSSSFLCRTLCWRPFAGRGWRLWVPRAWRRWWGVCCRRPSALWWGSGWGWSRGWCWGWCRCWPRSCGRARWCRCCPSPCTRPSRPPSPLSLASAATATPCPRLFRTASSSSTPIPPAAEVRRSPPFRPSPLLTRVRRGSVCGAAAAGAAAAGRGAAAGVQGAAAAGDGGAVPARAAGAGRRAAAGGTGGRLGASRRARPGRRRRAQGRAGLLGPLSGHAALPRTHWSASGRERGRRAGPGRARAGAAGRARRRRRRPALGGPHRRRAGNRQGKREAFVCVFV